MTARRAAAALLALAAAAPAAAYVRSTTNASNPTATGYCLWWNTRSVTYRINMSGFAGSACASPDPTTLANASFPAWSTPSCTDFKFANGGTSTVTGIGFDQGSSNNENTVVVRKGACTDAAVVPSADPCHGTAGACAATYNCWEHTGAGNDRTIALTTTTFHPSTGEIVDADMELFGWDGVTGGALPSNAVPPFGWYFTCGTAPPVCTRYGDSSCVYMDLGGTVTHEAGHMLGLDHPCQYSSLPGSTCPDPNAVMAPTAQVGDASKRTLTQDDANGVCAIYPAGKPADTTTGCFAQSPQATSSGGGGGCATAGAGEVGLLVVAALALRRRRRQATIAPA